MAATVPFLLTTEEMDREMKIGTIRVNVGEMASSGGIHERYGFNEETLRSLDPEAFREMAQMILEKGQVLPEDPESWLMTVIIPFLRNATSADKNKSLDLVLRDALIAVAQDERIKICHNDWGNVETEGLASEIRPKYQQEIRQAFDKLDGDTQAKILSDVRQHMGHLLGTMGVPTAVASLVVAGELSGFGVDLHPKSETKS